MRAKSKFALAVRFDEGPRLRATARFRGVSSFRDCERRKSLTVELDGRRRALDAWFLRDKIPADQPVHR